jgi:hypothetical protein
MYVRSYTEDALLHNRKALLDRLLLDGKRYIIDNWQPREKHLINCYIRFFTNLAVFSI